MENTLRIIFLKGHVFNIDLVTQPAAGPLPYAHAISDRNSGAKLGSRSADSATLQAGPCLLPPPSVLEQEEEQQPDKSCSLAISWYGARSSRTIIAINNCNNLQVLKPYETFRVGRGAGRTLWVSLLQGQPSSCWDAPVMLFAPQTPWRSGGSRPTALVLVPSLAPAALLPSSPTDGSCRWVGGLRKRKSTKAEAATILHRQAGSVSPALCRDAFLPARVPAYCRDLGATCCRAASVSFPINATSLKCSSLSALFIP